MKGKLAKFALLATLGLALAFTLSCSTLPDIDDTPNNGLIGSGTFVDNRDKRSYKFVKVNTQIWMAENLSYNASGSICYEYKNSNCTKYGKLYSWQTATTACPDGWKLPSATDWEILLKFLDPNCGIVVSELCPRAGNKLKTTKDWNDYEGESGNGVNTVGFSALPGGMGAVNDLFDALGNIGAWWGSDKDDSGNSYAVIISHRNDGVLYEYAENTNFLYMSVRCLKK